MMMLCSLLVLNSVQRLGYEQCAKNELIFGLCTKPKLYFLLIFLFAKMKFWRFRKYTTAFRFGTYPALLIANVPVAQVKKFP
ncbi:hypothetical protein SAMN05216556_13115 [Aequorivita viscosa]|uniref:Uncharacterized protein n=1 Tax=Aequorivita viscosa TaxID=797419 RepID=A0A1M6N7Z8_9FLAO|nr:hypothetical protein SAMN05216556_13115 [Aequorivita viscosa]SHJ91819.1 hypothetical protein SAMN04487908_1329 [Aequorivita viscosa]